MTAKDTTSGADEFAIFRAAYLAAFSSMMKYKPSEVGSGMYAEKMAAMADAHPEWVEQIEAE